MKTTITTEDSKEALRLIHSTNMACAIYNIQYNIPKKIQQILDTKDLTPQEAIKKYNELIQDELSEIYILELLD